jgi:hypothetical protein
MDTLTHLPQNSRNVDVIFAKFTQADTLAAVTK